jgi:hypothetical protein
LISVTASRRASFTFSCPLKTALALCLHAKLHGTNGLCYAFGIFNIDIIVRTASGITQSNLAEMKLKKSDDVVIRRLLGLQRGYGRLIGLDDTWAARIIEAVGNYGEMYERDLGSGSVMKLSRGANNLWTHGGLMYALPIR